MNSKQKAFLKELDALFDKYSIDDMNADKLEPVNFISNGSALSVGRYRDGEFTTIVTSTDSYTPTIEKGSKESDEDETD